MKSVLSRNLPPPVPPAGTDKDSRWKTVSDRLKVSFLILIIYLILNILHIGCPIKALSGISCPGCGMTRATLSALQFHFRDAFYYHPLFFLTPFMFFLFLFGDFINQKVNKAIWNVIILLFTIIYFYRLLFTENDVVTIDIGSGLVLKLLHYII
jgi:hypothetical protein